MAPMKMLILLAVLAVSCSAATATFFPQVIPTTAAIAAINHPCTQYCLLQQPLAAAGSPFLSSFPVQQQTFPTVASPFFQFQQQQCALHCALLSQMIQQQQIAAQQLAFISNPVAAAASIQFPYLSNPAPYLFNPMATAILNPLASAAIQSPYLFNPVTAFLSNPMVAAMQAPFVSSPIAAEALSNPMVAAMQAPCLSNPIFAAVQQWCAFNPAFPSAPCF